MTAGSGRVQAAVAVAAPSIGISPDRTLEFIPEGIRVIPDRGRDADVADVRPSAVAEAASQDADPEWGAWYRM